MNLASIIVNLSSVLVSIGTASSVFLHDTNVDKALVTAAADRAGVRTPVVRPGSEPHTHTDRGSLHQATRDLHSSQPRVQPRSNGNRKYVQSKPSARGHHPFDNYTLPVVS